ncbi:hypothetical protein B0H14DRAFT_3520459 [Mycena olivaceomarginata]|nr:hypothetical protein B0H14DRAFT_3520459 [Mycena olivaceomarginata]
MCYAALGDFKRSTWLLSKWKDLVARAGMQGGEFGSLLMNMEAEVYQLKTEYTEARRIQEVLLRQTSAVLCPNVHGYTLANIAFLDTVTGASTDVVSSNLRAATRVFQIAHYPRGISICELFHAGLLLREGDTAQARTDYMRLFASARSSDSDVAWSCLAKLADPQKPVHGDAEVARWAVVFLAFTLHASVRSLLTVHRALRCFGDVLTQQGAENSALSVLAIALEGFTWMDVHQSRAECMWTMGNIYLRRGDLCKASMLWKDARPLFERSLQTKAVSEIDARLALVKQHQEAEMERFSKLNVPTVLVQQQMAAETLSHDAFEVQVENIGAEAVGV